MKTRPFTSQAIAAFFCIVLFFSCANVPIKKFFIINYEPEPMKGRLNPSPYPYTVRVKEFEIEQAYARPQIVYRRSPFQLHYYFFQVWAVKPERMITDVVYKHLSTSFLVSHVVRRFDEGARPDFELAGNIEAIEEYDSEDVWFGHIALTLKLTRMKDNRTLYMRRFDRRKQVHQHDPELVVRELSQILDFIVSQALHDIDIVLAKELGFSAGQQISDTLSTGADGE
jgi:ABC-type uncharacterized transport system auxiliary subunit